LLRIGAAEIERHRDGISLTSPWLQAMVTLGLFDRSRPPAPDSAGVKSQLASFDKAIDSTPAFLWMITPDNSRAAQIGAGRAYARLQLAATAHGLAMQPISQAIQEYKEMAAQYQALHRAVGATAPGQTVQMWARVGYAPPVSPSPRRGLAAHLVSA
jgi:nitroreductase